MTAIEKLANTINNRCSRIQRANKDIVTEIGTINKDLSLKVTSIRNSIPKGDYMYLEPKPEAGDSVLVTWVGNEPIVIGKLYNS